MAKKINIIGGANKVLSEDESPFGMKFYEQHFGKIVVVIILLLSYIQLRYEYEERILSIGQLKRELNDVRYTSIEKWGRLTMQNRPEAIRARVAESEVPLIDSDEPPVMLE